MMRQSIGDLSTSFSLQGALAKTKSNISDLSSELALGVAPDLENALRGDYSAYLAFKNSIRSNDVRLNVLQESKTRAEIKQTALLNISDIVESHLNQLQPTISSSLQGILDQSSYHATSSLNNVVSAVNVTFAGNFLFSGDDVKSASLAHSDDMLSSIVSRLSGLTTLASIESEINNWFDSDPAGFATLGYLGSENDSLDVTISDQAPYAIPGRGDSDGIRNIVKGLAISAIAAEESLAHPIDIQKQLFEWSSRLLREGKDQIIGLSASIGVVQEDLDKDIASSIFQRSQSQIFLNDLIGIDEEQVAVSLQKSQFQLEKIFAIVARNSQMTLMDYV